jgi:hypothetical protein
MSACSEQPEEKKAETEHEKHVVRDVSLAVVNGSGISRDDLDFALRKLVGEEAAATLDEKAVRKVLESLVLSKAISQAQEKLMDAGEQEDVAREVAAFREKLLVHRYLESHGSPPPVTMEMVQKYYDDHPHLFKAESIRKYEMITSKRALQPAERDELLEKLDNPAQHQKWAEWVEQLSTMGYPVTYRQGSNTGQLLHAKLASALQGMKRGDISPLLFIEDRPYLIRVTEIHVKPAKPLSEVAGTITKALAPRQVKQAIEQVGKTVLSEADVTYLDDK